MEIRDKKRNPLNLNRTMKQMIFFFLGFCLYVLGVVGGTGYALYCHAYLIAAGVVVTGLLAWPTVNKYRKKLMED